MRGARLDIFIVVSTAPELHPSCQALGSVPPIHVQLLVVSMCPLFLLPSPAQAEGHRQGRPGRGARGEAAAVPHDYRSLGPT
eukprot:10457577-Alexandrium_andersonii.AAC.1